jgi:hypothetical protein
MPLSFSASARAGMYEFLDELSFMGKCSVIRVTKEPGFELDSEYILGRDVAADEFFDLRRWNQKNIPQAKTTATPPTTPPAIPAILVEGPGGDGGWLDELGESIATRVGLTGAESLGNAA